MSLQGYDLIGDVHGCAETLHNLLELLGYRQQSGCYRHPQRKVIFMGDIVDRGQRVREALDCVRSMVEAGVAEMVIGNHEYNAVAYHVQRPDGSFLRDHGPRHSRQIAETLEQFANHAPLWRDYLQWFRERPLVLENEQFRVVHACWDDKLISGLRLRGVNNFTDDAFLLASGEHGCFEWQVADRLLRGTYLPLPEGEIMVSADGYRRRFYRTKFWQPDAPTHGELAFQPDPLPEHLAVLPLSEPERQQLLHYDADQLPLFIGHYWRQGRPQPIVDNIACLDYSAVKNGRLVAYRWDAPGALESGRFVSVPVAVGDLPDWGDDP